MRLAWAFFKRDAIIATSYRVSFVVSFLGKLALLALFYFLARTIGDRPSAALDAYGGNFYGFLLVGIALSDCVMVGLMSFANQIREAQTTGTLEATLMSPVRLPLILLYSSLWDYFMSAVGFVFYLGGAALLFGLKFADFSLVAALTLFILTCVCFMGIGILWAGIILLVKRGDSIRTMLGFVVVLGSGVFFPTSLLPGWVQSVTHFIPLTDGLEGMRLVLLRGYGFEQLGGIMLRLSIFASLFTGAGLAGFTLTVRAAKRMGSLTQY
jgi:ABC-2 type transport system permease protein